MIGAMTNIADLLVQQRERREALRRPLELRVDVHGETPAGVSCRAENISLSGMFLHCAPTFALAEEIVRLEFWLSFSGMSKRCCMKVQIVRVADDGVGVCFHRCNAVNFRYIHKMMFERGAR